LWEHQGISFEILKTLRKNWRQKSTVTQPHPQFQNRFLLFGGEHATFVEVLNQPAVVAVCERRNSTPRSGDIAKPTQ
jgi:hypothetical protein